MSNFLKFSSAIVILAGVMIMSTFLGSFYTVDEGERAVVLRNKEVTGVAEPGLHFKLPFIDSIKTISLRTATADFPSEQVYTADRQNATVGFSINYTVLPGTVESIYRNYGSVENVEARMIIRQAREQIRNVFGTFTADTSIRERSRLNAEVTSAISKIGEGVIRIESVQIENIDFSDIVEQAAEQRARQEMLVQTKKQQLETAKVEAQITVAQAQANADSQLAAARSQAESVRLRGEAEAAAIKAKSDALAQSPNLVELTKAERWDGKLPTTFVPGSAVPFLNIK